MLATVAVVATGCGSRLGDEELRSAAGSSGGPSQDEPVTADGSATMIGSLPVPCGPGDRPPGTPPSDAPGVTAEAIEIAVISDRAGQVKVPTASIEESVAAFVEWCNGFGGVNGRTLELTRIDSKLFSHLEATQEACESGVFAIVGSGSVTDNQGAQEMVDCGLVEVPAYTATPAKALSDRVVSPLPNPADRYNVGFARWVAERHPDAIGRSALLFPDVDTASIQADRMREAYESEGFTFVVDRETGAIAESYAAEAIAMEEADVRWVTMVSATSEVVKLLRDMETQGFVPDVVDLGPQYYDAELAAEPAAEGALLQLSTVPFEEAADSPALQTYLDAYGAAASGDAPEPTALGVSAFSAGLLFATAAEALGDDLTRAGLLEELQAIRSWRMARKMPLSTPSSKSAPPLAPTLRKAFSSASASWVRAIRRYALSL